MASHASNFSQTSDGLYEFLEQFVTPHKLALFETMLEQRTRFLTVVLESVDKGHNASACLRSCECFGVQDLHIIRRSPDFKLRADVISGSGRWLTVRGYRGENERRERPSGDSGQGCGAPGPDDSTLRYFDKLRANGYRIAATVPTTDSISLKDYQPTQPTAVVFGSELTGLSEAAIENADDRIHIPMFGFTESFNLSVAVAIILHEIRGRLDPVVDLSLSPTEQKKLRRQWVKQAIGYKLDAYVRQYEKMTATNPG